MDKEEKLNQVRRQKHSYEYPIYISALKESLQNRRTERFVQHAYDDRNSRFQFYTIIGAILSAIITSLTLFTSLLQNYISDRPFTNVSEINLSPVNDKSFSMNLTFENTGSTRTDEMHAVASYIVGSSLPSGFTRCEWKDLTTTRITLGARQKTTIAFQTVNKNLIEDFASGKVSRFYIWGRITYLDSISMFRHQTRFCWDVNHTNVEYASPGQDINIVHSLCNEGNCIDDECKTEDLQNYTFHYPCSIMIVQAPGQENAQDTHPASK